MAATLQIQDPLLTTEEFAAFVRIHPKHAVKMRRDGTGPEFVRTGTGVGAAVRYRASAVEKWLRGRTVKPARKPRAKATA